MRSFVTPRFLVPAALVLGILTALSVVVGSEPTHLEAIPLSAPPAPRAPAMTAVLSSRRASAPPSSPTASDTPAILSSPPTTSSTSTPGQATTIPPAKPFTKAASSSLFRTSPALAKPTSSSASAERRRTAHTAAPASLSTTVPSTPRSMTVSSVTRCRQRTRPQRSASHRRLRPSSRRRPPHAPFLYQRRRHALR